MDYDVKDLQKYEDLVNAIILRAVDDYEMAISVLSTEYHPKTLRQEQSMVAKRVQAERMKHDCESFFNGKWYKTITTVPAELILNNILDGIKNAKNVVYNEEAKKYLCTCGDKLGVLKVGVGRPVIKCNICKKYWRVYGEPVEIE